MLSHLSCTAQLCTGQDNREKLSMAQPATRYLSQELAGINFGQAKLALEQRFLEERSQAATKAQHGDAVAAKKQKISTVRFLTEDAASM